jgi:hypothetical protein
MTVTAVLKFEGMEYPSGEYVIGAFVDGECRGIAQPIHLSTVNRHVVFLMIHSNQTNGETVDFRAFVPAVDAVYGIDEVLTSQADAALGTVSEPLSLNANNVEFEISKALPTTHSLAQNYPNPFNAGTVISYTLRDEGHVSLEVFDLLGRRVMVLVDQHQPVGRYKLAWDGRNASGRPLASGVYFYRLTAGDVIGTRKMVLLK